MDNKKNKEKLIKELQGIYNSSKVKDYDKSDNKSLSKAAAFRLDQESKEVELLAIGVGEYANLIEQEAKKNNIPVYQDKDLVQELIKFDINTNLPPHMYDAIVQVINFVAKVSNKYERNRT